MIRHSFAFTPLISRTACAFLGALTYLALAAHPADAQSQLVNGKRITLPPLGVVQPVGSMPMALALTKDGKYAISLQMGYRQSVCAIRTSDGMAASHVDFNNSPDRTNGLYYGLAVSPVDGAIYASQGAHSSVAVLSIDGDGTLSQTGTIAGDKYDFTAGIALDVRGCLYVVNNEYDNTLTYVDPKNLIQPGSLAIYICATRSEVGRVAIGSLTIPTALGDMTPSSFPLAVAVRADGSAAYITNERDATVTVIDTGDPTKPTVKDTVPVGSNPDALLLSPNQSRLYVANANSDTVSVVDTHADRVIATVVLRPAAFGGLPGATPTGLALSPDAKKLYVTLADMDAVAVVDLSKSQVIGYVPTGWYPGAVVAAGDKLMVANAKGTQTRNPNAIAAGPNGAWGTYVLSIIDGSVSSFDAPAAAALKTYTAQVLANNRVAAAAAKPNPLFAALRGKIKHVIYIVKENRTNDQVLGDMPEGNGDPSLTLFGKVVTPNQHALARRFVLLDNFYCCGEVSGEGWPWSTQGLANAYVMRNIPYNYSGRGRQYDFEGQNNGYLTGGFDAKDPYGQPLSNVFPNGAPPIRDVAEAASGHIWDAVRKRGLTYRNYGFNLSFGKVGVLPDNYPAAHGLRPAGHDLGGITDIDFRGFDLSYADSDAGATYFSRDSNSNALWSKTIYGHDGSPSRFAEWDREFHEMLASRKPGAVPSFMTVRFMNDHTSGARGGYHSPKSSVADNDYAVGQLVEAISRSRTWKSTAMFVVEDDAQDGEDHVDAHRSTCYVISPYIRQSTIDHAFYNTDSVLRTMELLLDVPPMNQYDAIAAPIGDFAAAPINAESYKAILPAENIIADVNLKLSQIRKADPRYAMALESQRMDFVHPDSAPAQKLNAIVWKTVRGASSTPPPPRLGALSGSMPNSKPADDDGD